jgi:hypothetical protein
MSDEEKTQLTAGLREFDFGLIQQPFDTLRIAMANKVEREWPGKSKHTADGGQALILGLYKASENYLAATRFLIADQSPIHTRKPEFALALSPLIRAILDALCTTVYLFGSFEDRVIRHYKAGWREIVEETARLKQAYAADPDWTTNLAARDEMIVNRSAAFGIRQAEQNDVKRIKRFPIPDHMYPPSNTGVRARYIRYLIDWFYRTLSQDAHLSFSGIGRSLPLLTRTDLSPEARKLHLALRRSNAAIAAFTLMMALITELELELRFDLAQRAKYVWSVLNDWSPEPREVYNRFYSGILGPANAKVI